MRTEPGGQLLISCGFGVGVGACAQHHHEQRSGPDLPADRIMHGDRSSRPVDETLFAGLVLLTDYHILLPAPPSVKFVEATVAVSFRMHLSVLFPCQLQCQMGMLLQLLVEGRKIRKGSLVRAFYRTLLAEHGLFDASFVPAFRQWPGNPGGRHFLQVIIDCPLTARTSSGDLPLPQP